jgi:hypothetical protein
MIASISLALDVQVLAKTELLIRTRKLFKSVVLASSASDDISLPLQQQREGSGC